MSEISRRAALKAIAAAAAAPGMLASCEPAADGEAGAGVASTQAPTSNPLAAGTAWDPDLLAPVVPWDPVLTEDELQTLAALCDVILPADDRSASASAVGCHEYIDEWVSAPYEAMERDRVTVRGGLVWLDQEAARRFGAGTRFRALSADQLTEICDDICFEPEAAPGFRTAARFFDKVRDLTLTAFYTTQEGMDDLGYVGNVPLARWDPPPPDALRHVGLE